MTDSKRSPWGAGIVGGIVGSLLTAAILMLAVPQLLAPKLVRSGLMEDPQILVDAADALRDKQYAPTIATINAALTTPFATSWTGSREPDVTVVEFYDYACPYCKASTGPLDRLTKEDSNVRVVYRELPILGPHSVTAARLALAASKAGRFRQFHDAMFAAGRPSPETLAAAARAAGISPEPPADPAIEAEIRRNMQLAGQLGATGTPLFVIGDRVINSAAGYEALKKAVEDAREES